MPHLNITSPRKYIMLFSLILFKPIPTPYPYPTPEPNIPYTLNLPITCGAIVIVMMVIAGWLLARQRNISK
jgi:hypothetical protein